MFQAPAEEVVGSAAPADAGGFSAPADEIVQPKSLAGFGQNLVNDAKDTGTGVLNLVGKFADSPMQTTLDTAKALPDQIVNEGKRLGVGELLTGHPINAVEKFGQAVYDKPLTTALDVAPVVGAAGKALGFGAEAADAADTAALGAPAAAGAPAIADAAAPASAAPAANALDDVRSYIGQKTNAAKDAATSQFSRQTQRPGWAGDTADYLQEKSQMMAHQQMGASPLQARQIGHEGMRAIGQYALDNDIVSPTNGLRGMRARNAELMDNAGETLSGFRKEADTLRDPVATPVDVLQEVKSRLDSKYTRGAHSGEAGQYAKALEDVEDADPSFEGFSDVATKLNKAANEANRLKQPHSAFTDVANVMSEINNDRIKDLLGPQKAAQYEQALRAYGVNKKISSFLERKAAGEVKRLGPGSLTSNLVQKGLDEVGYRVGAKATNKLSTAVLKNPGLAKDLPGLFKEFIHHVDDVTDPGLAHGGIVGETDLNDFLSSKYQNKGAIKK